MAEFYDRMAEEIDNWITQSGTGLSPGARRQIENLIADAEQRITPQTLVAHDRPRTNLRALLDAAKKEAGAQTIDQHALERALISLCPLFPFC